MRRDLNVDIGEGFPHDAALLEFATSANVCCGVHAGSWDLTLETIELCRSRGTRIGVHPGYPNREVMGRVHPDLPPAEIEASLRDQVLRFTKACSPAYIKPHGAWYNELLEPVGGFEARRIAQEIALEYELPLMVLPAVPLGVAMIREGFADRAYEPDGSLRKRSLPGAVLHDPADVAYQVRRLAKTVDSICLHGDTPDALMFAELVTKTLRDAGYEVGP